MLNTIDDLKVNLQVAKQGLSSEQAHEDLIDWKLNVRLQLKKLHDKAKLLGTLGFDGTKDAIWKNYEYHEMQDKSSS